MKILFQKESTEGVAEGQTTASFTKPDKCENSESELQTQHVVDK